jgi:hypothetical protein
MKRYLIPILTILLLASGLLVGCAHEESTFVITQTPRPTPVSTPRGYIYTNGSLEVGGDGEPIELVNNPNATNPSFAKLVAFINKDPTDKYSYILGPPKVAYVCSDFAEDVHNNAEAAGIRAAWVGIDIWGHEAGHALNAFETTDVGLVFIDCTGKGLWSTTLSESSWDRRAYVEKGKQYGFRDINGAATWFEFIASVQLGDRIIEWLQNHSVRELGQEWMDKWLTENRKELSGCGWIREPIACYGGTTGPGGETYRIKIGWRIGVDCIEAPWFRHQVEAIFVDGIPVTWNVTWHEQWINPQLGVVKDIHIHW